ADKTGRGRKKKTNPIVDRRIIRESTKFYNLRNQFNVENAKIKSSMKSGIGTNDCLFRVTRAINKVMIKNNIFMFSEDEAEFISLQFKKKSISQLIGCIDGTHIPITAPREDYRFRNVVIKHPGSVHDAAVLKDSSLYKNAQTIIPQISKNIDGMDVDYTVAPQIILACFTLHNFVESHKEQFFIEWLQEVLDSDQLFP
ncbi:hypothetical protein ALC60_07151, partial [Trachymyrmex zeteki]